MSRVSVRRPFATIETAKVPSFLFLAVLVFGGGAGTGYPLVELVAQLLALGLIVGAVWSGSMGSTTPALRKFLWLFAAAALVLALQLPPLPPTWWQALPGRETAVQVYGILGWSDRWHALSLAPDATLAALLSFLVPFAAMVTVAALSLRHRIMMLRLIVGAAAIGTVFAALQVAAGATSAPILYETAHRGFGVGFFVNRNHQAMLLLVAIPFAAVPGVLGTGPARLAVTLGTVAFLALGILATSSRTALMLLPLALIVALALIVGVRRSGRPLAGAATLYLVGGLLLLRTELVQKVLARFATVAEELRYQYWENSAYLVREVFPFGSGFGSFERVYRAVEPLGQVSPLSVNHAHNDWLEVVLEGGLPAAVLLVLALVVLIVALISAWKTGRDRQERATVVAAGAAIALILLFSLVDYPLRMAGIAGVFGAALGLLAAVGRPAAATGQARPWWAWSTAFVALLVGIVASGDTLGRFLVLNKKPAAATAVAPWSAAAWSALADQEQLAGRPKQARIAAERALAIVPIDAAAVRAHGFADLTLDAPDRGSQLLQVGAALGWRDTLMQLWLAQRALEVGSTAVAAERIDALLRRAQLPDALMPRMRETYLMPTGVEALIGRLADRPYWRQGFFNTIADDSAASVPRTLDFLAKLRVAGVPATPHETLLMRWRLADRGDVGAAREVWLASGGRGSIADGDFEALPAQIPAGVPPYAWGAPSLPGVRVFPIDRGAGTSRHAIQIVSDGLASGTALAQIVALPPGRWRVSGMVRGSDVPATLTVACITDGKASLAGDIALDGSDAAWRPVSGVVMIGPDCPVQQIGVTLRDRGGQNSRISIDAIQISSG
jgi:O-antigen ligase